MSWSTQIHIKFYKVGPVLQTLSVLRNAGWGFDNDTICYDHYPDPDDPSFSQKQAPATAWPQVLSLLEAKSQAGETITLDFLWQGDGPRVTCLMHPADDLLILPDASPPRLPGSRHLTDFSWLLVRLAVPLTNAGFDIQFVECYDTDPKCSVGVCKYPL